MADTLVVYYSLEGNVDFLAREIADEMKADLLRLETEKEYPKKGLVKFFHGGKDAISNARPKLKTAIPDLSGYSTIVIGTPVWAGKPAAPINTFLAGKNFSEKKVAVFASSAGGAAEKTFSAIADASSASLFATQSFKNPLANETSSKEIARMFARIVRGL